MRLAIATLAVIGTMTATRPAAADGIANTGIAISQPWARATPGGAKVAAGYVTITNAGQAPDRLIGGSTTVSAALELHDTSLVDGVVRMRRIENGIALAPGATIRLEPGGMHIMLIDLKTPLTAGHRIEGTLTFEKAGTVQIVYEVAPIGAPALGSSSPSSSHQHH
jgi:copper(I)-binding protein